MKITWRYTSLTIAFMIGLSGGGWHWRTASPVASLAVWPVDNRVGRVAENDRGLLARDPLAVPPPELDDAPPALPD